MKKYFGNVKIEELEFLVLSNKKSSNIDIVYKYLFELVIFLSIIIFILFILHTINKKAKTKLILNYKFKINNKKITLFPIKFNLIMKIMICLFFVVFFVYKIEKQYNIKEYIANKNLTSEIYDKYYVNPNSVNITFPNKKRNLIYIYLESMETSYAKYKYKDELVSLIPNLEKHALENISFSNINSFGGLYQVSHTSWTADALVSYSSGVPLNIPIYGNDYGKYESFLPGITSLGNILEKEGYNQVYLIGSDAEFGGRKNYYTQHGNFEILDYNYAKYAGKISDDYFEFWGYEDKKLFDFAKEELNNLSKKEEPFNLTLLTVDTHFMDGYVDETCEIKFDEQYANAIYCSDKKINNFLKWVKKQPFYENTTIVLVGDHLTMNSNFTDNFIQDDRRTIYNSIINSPIKTINKNRQASSLDYFPTTLASLGVSIEGERLGLGTNLFSDNQTLIESLSLKTLNKELSKKSIYYNNNFINNNK